MENRVNIFETSLEHVAILKRDHLVKNGIDAIILNQKDSSYNTFGLIKILVTEEDEAKARAILADLENE